MRSSESIASLAPALVKALAALEELPRDRTATVETRGGGSYRYTYTDLAAVLKATRPILAAHDIAVVQAVTADATTVAVETTILHSSGEWLTVGPAELPAGGTPQTAGATVSYLRRYQLLAVLGLGTEDDDAAEASQPPTIARRADGVSDGQIRKMAVLFTKLGITARDDRIEAIRRIVGRPVGSSKELTVSEASKVIDVLEAHEFVGAALEPVEGPAT